MNLILKYNFGSLGGSYRLDYLEKLKTKMRTVLEQNEKEVVEELKALIEVTFRLESELNLTLSNLGSA